MNAKKLVKATNIVGMVAVVLLVYWVFVLILSNVFGLKVFREYITEIFLMSILGDFCCDGGCLDTEHHAEFDPYCRARTRGRKQRWPENLIFVVGRISRFGRFAIWRKLSDGSEKTSDFDSIARAHRQGESIANQRVGRYRFDLAYIKKRR